MLGLGLSLGNPLLRVSGSDVPSSFWEPTAWAWFDGQTEIKRTTALTTAPASASNVFFAGWFSPEGVGVASPLSGVLGLLYSYGNQTVPDYVGNSLVINRVAQNAPVNRFSMKDFTATVNTTSTEYANASAPVNSARYFIAVYIDQVTPANSTMAIFSGTAWGVTTGTLGVGAVIDAREIYPISIGAHNLVGTAQWWGRLSSIALAYDITPIDLTVAAVRNALLVDPGAAGAGYGVGTLPVFFGSTASDYQAGNNLGGGGAFDTITAGSVASYPYTQQRSIFNGSTNKLELATVTGLTNPLAAFTLSAWYRTNSSTGQTLFALKTSAGGLATFSIVKPATTNKLRFNCTDSVGTAIATSDGVNTSASAMLTGATDASKNHILIVGSIAGDVLTGYLNGTEVFTTAIATANLLSNFGDMSGCNLGVSSGGATLYLNGSLGDVWFADSYLDPATYLSTFYGGGTPPLLTGYKGAVGGVTPKVWTGQGMNAANWNAGRNLGTGGTFTKTGTDMTLGA